MSFLGVAQVELDFQYNIPNAIYTLYNDNIPKCNIIPLCAAWLECPGAESFVVFLRDLIADELQDEHNRFDMAEIRSLLALKSNCMWVI